MPSAPGLVLEAALGKSRGWLSSGICPNLATHFSGYHMPEPKPGDYSLRGALNKPIGSYCCAYDMQTMLPGSRRYVASVFERIRAGIEEPSRAEFIGSWDGRNVWYWNWERGNNVVRYAGNGHDTWCHNSVFRSLAGRSLGWLAAYDSSGNLIRKPEGTANMPAYGDTSVVPIQIQPQFPKDMNIPVGWDPPYSYVMWQTYVQSARARAASESAVKELEEINRNQAETNRLLAQIVDRLPEPPTPS